MPHVITFVVLLIIFSRFSAQLFSVRARSTTRRPMTVSADDLRLSLRRDVAKQGSRLTKQRMVTPLFSI